MHFEPKSLKSRNTLPTACLAVYFSPFSRRHFTPPHTFRAGQVTNIPTRYDSEALSAATSFCSCAMRMRSATV